MKISNGANDVILKIFNARLILLYRIIDPYGLIVHNNSIMAFLYMNDIYNDGFNFLLNSYNVL